MTGDELSDSLQTQLLQADRVHRQLRADLATESLAVDALLQAMGEDPQRFRTDGGAVNRGRLLAWLKERAAQQQSHSGCTEAVRDVLAERQRQISGEGWTAAHDDLHRSGGMAVAAACYAITDVVPANASGSPLRSLWPWTGWAESWWKPKDRRHNLIRAGALILAEIERLDRMTTRTVTLPSSPAGDA